MTNCPDCKHLKLAHDVVGACAVPGCTCVNKNFAQQLTITLPAYADTAEGVEPNPQLSMRLKRAVKKMDRQRDAALAAATALEEFAASIPGDVHDPRHIADMARAKAAEIRRGILPLIPEED